MHHSWRPLVALAGLLIVGPTQIAAQQPTTGALTVRVTDAANQRPIEAARVFLVGTNFGGQTTPEGRVLLRALAPGSYTVRVLRVGYTEQSRSVTVAAAAHRKSKSVSRQRR